MYKKFQFKGLHRTVLIYFSFALETTFRASSNLIERRFLFNCSTCTQAYSSLGSTLAKSIPPAHIRLWKSLKSFFADELTSICFPEAAQST
jgi:hypothetical protein